MNEQNNDIQSSDSKRRGGFNNHDFNINVVEEKKFAKKKRPSEEKRTTVKIFKETKNKIDNIIDNRKDKHLIHELKIATDIYSSINELVGDDVEDKQSYVENAIKEYKKNHS